MKQIRYHTGFTLIEIIAILLLTSIAGGILYLYFNSVFVESQKTISDVQKFYDLHKVMENIIADYSINHPEWLKRQPRWQKLTYYPVSAMIRASGDKGFVYICSVAGKSGKTEPSGFAVGDLAVDEGIGMVKWKKRNGLNDLKNKIAAIPSEYGTYTVQENKFIKFISVSADTYEEEDILSGEPETILKVTISNDSGASLTNLFTNVN